MRILLVSQEVPPETAWGGIGTYVGVLAPALAAAGHDVHVLSVVVGQTRADSRSDGGVAVHRRALRRPRGVGRVTRLPETWGRWSLARAVAREVDALVETTGPFDVVESPNWNAEGLHVAADRRAPVVVRLHSWASQIFTHFSPRGLDARFAVGLEERLVRAADVVIGTRVQIDDAERRLGVDPAHLRVIPPPVPSVTTAPIPPEDPPTILFVGRLEERKGPDIAVRALRLVADARPDARLIVAGRDSSASGIPSYATWLLGLASELGVRDRVEIIERPDDDDVADLRRRSTVCLMPSRWESFGYVAAEALAAGRAVVASDVGGLRDVVDDGETGFLVGCDDVGGWARAIVALLDDRAKAARFGELGARRIQERYGAARIAGVTVDAYADAATHFWGHRATHAAVTP